MHCEIPVHMRRNEPLPEYGDLRDAFDLDTLFVVLYISDAMRRGVPYFKLDHTPLQCVNDVLDVLAEEGEVLLDLNVGKTEMRH